MPENPRLRPELIFVPVQVSGEKLLLLQDPERWCEELVFVPIEFAVILQYFTGELSVREIQEKFMREAEQLVPSDVIEKIAQELDNRHLLDSENFRSYISQIQTEWNSSEVRPATLAGLSYPKEPEELKKFLDAFYTAKDGPGIPLQNTGDQLKGIVVPHIELSQNGRVYAQAYKKLFEESGADLFLVFGTGHTMLEDILVFTEKHFETPLGTVPTDRDFVRGVRSRLRKKSFAGDFAHRREHSIELQVIFLQHLFAGKRDFKIVPVITGSLQTMIEMGSSPAEDLLVKDYIRAVREEIKESGKKVALIASGDFAHLGPKYGDRETFAAIREDEIKAEDDKMLDHLAKGDAESFFQQIAQIEDQRKICGLAPIYMICKIAEPGRGEILKWAVSYDSETKSAVSFAAIAFY